MVGVRVEMTGMGQVLSYFSGVMKRFRTELDEAPRRGATLVHTKIKNKIASGMVTPALAPSTVQKRAAGKSPGVRPAEPSVKGSRPLYRTGALYNAIVMRRMGKGAYSVFVEARPVPGSPGLDTATLAGRLEKGYSVAVPVSLGMLRYLAVLFEWSAGRKGGRARANVDTRQKTGKRIVIEIPARPLWGTTVKELEPEFARLAGRSARMIVGA
jgi:hypothetical protein